MKKFTKKIKYVVLAFVLLCGLHYSTNEAFASYVYEYGDIPYVVSASNTPPVANAGAPQSVILPANSVTIGYLGATATDAEDGVVANAGISWSEVSRPSGAPDPSITYADLNKHLEPTFSNLVEGFYTFRLTVTDSGGLTDTDDMTVQVKTSVANIPPVAYAGSDQSISQPSSSVSVIGSGTDSDGTIVGYNWVQIGTNPAIATIVNPSSPSTPITGLSAVGTYTFELTVTDDQGATGSDQMQVIVGPILPPTPSGVLTVSPNTCTIALNASKCTVTGASWTTSNTTDPKLVATTSTNTSLISNTANQASAIQVDVAYPSTKFDLMDGSTILDTKTATANCGANSWDGTKCAASTVNGICSPSHFNCTAGVSANNSGTGPWTWDCQGQNGGSTVSCSEVNTPQCSDAFDNDGDGLNNELDPGCHTDGIVHADPMTTYNPNDNSERNTPKIIEKEL